MSRYQESSKNIFQKGPPGKTIGWTDLVLENKSLEAPVTPVIPTVVSKAMRGVGSRLLKHACVIFQLQGAICLCTDVRS